MKDLPKPVVTPIVHLNGTSREALSEALCEAYAAVNEALDKLRLCAPNGRDYYPEPGKMQRAEEQHRTRGEYLKAVLDSLQEEAETIAFG